MSVHTIVQVRVPATIVLLALSLAAGCGGNDDDPEPARSTTTTQTAPQAPPRPPAQPQVPRSDRDAAIAVVSRYADALQSRKFARACSLLAPRSGVAGGCAAELERFARRSDVLRLARTVPLWESGAVDSGTGAIRGRVKIGFPAQPETRWVFRVVKEAGRRWRVSSAIPQAGQGSEKGGESGT